MSTNTELKAMDEQLERAARKGDIHILNGLVTASQADNNYSSFLSVVTNSKSGKNGNIFHLAAWDGRDEFFKEARDGLPRSIVQDLLTHREPSIRKRIGNSNPLHVAASQGHLSIVNLILDFYETRPLDNQSLVPIRKPWLGQDKPWVGQDGHGSTPLHIALWKGKEDCALALLHAFDMKIMKELVNFNDHRRKSPLYLAVKYGCSEVATEILTCVHPYTFDGNKGQTPLHFAPKCSEEVCKLLFQKHPQLIKNRNDNGYTVLLQWLKIGDFWPFEFLMNNEHIAPEIKSDLISLIDLATIPSKKRKKIKDQVIVSPTTPRVDKTPLLVALDQGNARAVRNLVEAYIKERNEQASTNSLQGPLPWLRRNKDGKTPLDLAILDHKEEIAMCFLSSSEINFVLEVPDNPLFLAIEKQCYQVAKRILDIQGLSSAPGSNRNVLHGATNYKEEVARWLVTQLPSFIYEKDMDGKTPLDEASEKGSAWLVEMMLTTNPSSLSNKEPYLAWVKACEGGHFSTVQAFINHCPNLRDVCLEVHDTPLHHIKLGGYTSYKEFLKMPIMEELKYIQSSVDGATPFHRAISNDEIGLAEALLFMNWIDWRIKDNFGNTAMDLLDSKRSGDYRWDKMWKRVTNFQHEENLLDLRSTLLVVAGLLATFTSTAAFTLPGGFDSHTGEAFLAKKAEFKVFIIADAYAWCCSVLVLFFLVCSMVCERNKSFIWIKRSMLVLPQSLYGIVIAFMAGVYTVIFRNSLWVAILIFVMCGLVAIFATIWILTYILPDKRWIKDMLLKLWNACKGWVHTSWRSLAAATTSSIV